MRSKEKTSTKKTVAKKPAAKRISGFSFKRSGVTQSLNEEDYFSRSEFLKERRDFIREGVKIKDKFTKKPYVNYRDR